MNSVSGAIKLLIALLSSGCVYFGAAAAQTSSEWIGSTPGEVAREFVGGIASTAAVHCIAWRVTFSARSADTTSGTFKLAAAYEVPTRSNPNRGEAGPKVTAEGTWEIVTGMKAKPDATVYRLTTGRPERSVSFVKVSDVLLHLLAEDKSLMNGTGGWSYTLNRADVAEKPRELTQTTEMSYTISPLATGPTVFGVFEGRTPCLGISRELNRPERGGCIKAKWRVTLYQNPETSAPTIYKVEGSLYRQGAREGNWTIVGGTATNPNAVIYRLEPTQTEPALLLLKGDDDVLFFLDQKQRLMVGNADFSYTLNRRAK